MNPELTNNYTSLSNKLCVTPLFLSTPLSLSLSPPLSLFPPSPSVGEPVIVPVPGQRSVRGVYPVSRGSDVEHAEDGKETHRTQSGDQTGLHHRAAEERGRPAGGEERRSAEEAASDRPGGEGQEGGEARGRSQESVATKEKEIKGKKEGNEMTNRRIA